jgi:tetratricopeptide (TPR) repeat protein
MVFRAQDINPQAVTCFAEAARLDSDDARWPYLIGTTNILLAGEVISPLREAYRLATEPDRKRAARLRLAERLLDSGAIDEAGGLFAEQLRQQPDDVRAHLGFGMVALTRDDPNQAIRHLEVAANSPHARTKAFGLLATAHRRLGHPADAARYEMQAAASTQDTVWPDPFLAEYLTKQVGRRELEQRAKDLESQGRFQDAVAVREELASAYPDDETGVSLGKVLARAGDIDRAEQVLQEALQKYPNHAAGHFYLGRVFSIEADYTRRRGDATRADSLEDAAIREFRRCCSLNPGHGAAHLDAAKSLLRLKRYAEAREEAQEAVRISPQTSETHFTVGQILLESGKPRDAIPSLEEAAKLAAPQDDRPRVLLEKARAAANR